MSWPWIVAAALAGWLASNVVLVLLLLWHSRERRTVADRILEWTR